MKPIFFRRLPILCMTALFVALGPEGAGAATATQPARLDQKQVHADYTDGDFEKVLAALEGFMDAYPTWSYEDSVFIAKHLAVVYSAHPATREKGKYYMHRLLALSPSAKLVDMYVSEEIDRIFDKVREESLARRKNSDEDAAYIARPGNAPVNDPPGHGSPAAKAGTGRGGAGFWIAGGAAVAVAALTAAYFMHQGEKAPSDRVYKVPND